MSLSSQKELIAGRMYNQTSAGAKGNSPKYTQHGYGGKGGKPNYRNALSSPGGKGKKANYDMVGGGGKGKSPAYVQVGQSPNFKGKYNQRGLGKTSSMPSNTTSKSSQKGRGSLERAAGRNLGEKMMLGKNEATRP